MKNFILLIISIAMLVSYSCKKKTPDPDPVPYTSFTLNGIQKKFTSYTKFSKDLCVSSTFCCSFSASSATDAETLKFGIPGDPVVGYVYQTGERRYSCYYISAAGVRYDVEYGNIFQTVFSQWQGQGGWGLGSFSGVMKSAEGDSVIISGGFFQNQIFTSGTK